MSRRMRMARSVSPARLAASPAAHMQRAALRRETRSQLRAAARKRPAFSDASGCSYIATIACDSLLAATMLANNAPRNAGPGSSPSSSAASWRTGSTITCDGKPPIGRARHSSAVAYASAARPASQSASALAHRIIEREVTSTDEKPYAFGEDRRDLLVEPEVRAREHEVHLDVVALPVVERLGEEVARRRVRLIERVIDMEARHQEVLAELRHGHAVNRACARGRSCRVRGVRIPTDHRTRAARRRGCRRT